MLIDKPGDDPAESEREPESIKNNTAVPLRKTKQQRRKAEKLRAEVRSFLTSYASSTSNYAARNTHLCSGRCENGCMRPSILPSPYAKPQRGRRPRVPRSQHSGVQSGRPSSRRVVWRDRNLANTWCAREKWMFSLARSSVRVCVVSRCVMHVIMCRATVDAAVGSPRATCSGIDI